MILVSVTTSVIHAGSRLEVGHRGEGWRLPSPSLRAAKRGGEAAVGLREHPEVPFAAEQDHRPSRGGGSEHVEGDGLFGGLPS